jgi:hypothetical protein
MSTIVANTSFKVVKDGIKTDVVEAVGNPTTGDDDISIWFAANVPLDTRQSNNGNVKSIRRYIKSKWDDVAPIGTAMIFHMDFNGTYEDVEVNGTPTSDQIRIEVGDNIYTQQNSSQFIEGVNTLIDAYLEASTGN